MSAIDKIIKLATSQNIAEDLDDQLLTEIGSKVIRETEIDIRSMAKWLERNEDAMKIAMQIAEDKNFPWQGAANVKFPLIANGAITFASREYPQIVRGNSVVDAAIFGKDPDGSKIARAKRISKFMSWQLLVDSDDWESETDKMLVVLAVVGTVFRKGYFNPVLNKPVFELCRPDHVYINNNVKSLEKARRITHKIYMYSNDIVEHIRLGLYKDVDIKELDSFSGDNPEIQFDDPDRPHEILEQHRYLDLDGDGYQEPYIVTVHRGSQKVLRIVARYSLEDIKYTDNKKIKFINPQSFFHDFHFLPSPDGKFLSLGLGTLLFPLNSSINSLINQLLDSGTLLNAQPVVLGGGARIKAGEFRLAPGVINRVEGTGGYSLKDNLLPLPLTPPSPVLFQLLGLMIDVGKELASVTDILQGQQPTQNSPATTVLALIKQGLVQYNAIHKRVLRSFKKEFNTLYRLNHEYLDIEKYLNMVDDETASVEDFNILDLDIKPVADPNMSSDVQRIAKAQSIYSMPEVDRKAAAEMMLDSLDVEDYEKQALIPPVDPNNPPPPPPEVQKVMAEIETEKVKAQTSMIEPRIKAAELEMKSKELELKMKECESKIQETEAYVKMLQAQAVKYLAEATKAKKEADHVGDRPASTSE